MSVSGAPTTSVEPARRPGMILPVPFLQMSALLRRCESNALSPSQRLLTRLRHSDPLGRCSTARRFRRCLVLLVVRGARVCTTACRSGRSECLLPSSYLGYWWCWLYWVSSGASLLTH